MKKIISSLILFYQNNISVHLPRRCKYYPTCSEYAMQAVKTHGVTKGLFLFFLRFLRCNPWSKGGVNFVPDEGEWKAKKWVAPNDWSGNELDEELIYFIRHNK